MKTTSIAILALIVIYTDIVLIAIIVFMFVLQEHYHS